ncbi:MAG: rhodanese-like domain-containing protein [Cellulosilyticaceae bacterium]
MGLFDTVFNKTGVTPVVRKIGVAEAKSNLAANPNIVLLDVREDHEYKAGHIRGAKNLSVAMVQQRITRLVDNKDTILYVYCQSGARSTRACQILVQLGYTQIYNLGGISSWPYEVVRG